MSPGNPKTSGRLLLLGGLLFAAMLVLAGVAAGFAPGEERLWAAMVAGILLLPACALVWAARRALVVLVREYAAESQMHADERERLRQEFRAVLEGAAHDLGQPLTTLHGTLELALFSGGRSPAGGAAIEEALEQSQRAMIITRRLAELAETESLGERAVRVSLGELLESLRQDAEVLAEARRVHLTIECGADPAVLAAPGAIEASLLRLLEESCERSPPGSVVRLSLTRENGFASLAISDEGPPIPAEELSHWFDPRYRRPPPKSGAKRDALQAVVVRRTVEAIGGSLTACCGPSGGAEFRIRLPLA